MISIIIPTKNRGYTLIKTLSSYFEQEFVTEVIIIDDAGCDDTQSVLENTQKKYPHIEMVYFKNQKPHGSSSSKNKGVNLAKNDWILIGEDDAYLEKNYTRVLLEKFSRYETLGIASGRWIDLEIKEAPEYAIKRFGFGNPLKQYSFDYHKFGHVPDAYYREDIFLPLTHPMILTKKALLIQFPYDTDFEKGNGYREESDFHINVFLHGYHILVTNDTHTMHMCRQEVRTGGYRTSYFKRVLTNISHTHYFYKKYYTSLKKKLPLPRSQMFALLLFSLKEIQEMTKALLLSIKKRWKKAF